METLITSEVSGQLWNACAWDLHSGTSLVTYKGAAAGQRSLCTINNNLVISANANKPHIQLWSIHKDAMLSKFSVSGLVSALAVSPNGRYAVGGIQNKLHVWQITTGNLLAVLSKHYQNISVIRFSNDGAHFISGGDDSLALVWSLASVISEQPIETGDQGDAVTSRSPRHVWSKHSLPVSDIYVGVGGSFGAWVVTSSRDMTCNLYELASGRHLCKFVYESAVTAVTMDTCNYSLFAGLTSGDIALINLYQKNCMDPPTYATGQSVPENNKVIFKSHTMGITCLTTNMDDTLLISGSRDGSVRVWDIESGGVIRTFKHKGAITNILAIVTPPGMLNNDSRADAPVYGQFRKHLISDIADKSSVHLKIQCRSKEDKDEDYFTNLRSRTNAANDSSIKN